MATPYDLTSFAAGEIAPSLFGHVDLAKFNTAATTLRNMYVGYRGGAYSRAGTLFCGRSKQNASAPPPRLIRFQYSITQGYTLEFGDNYMRIVSNGGSVVEPSFGISGVSLGDPVQIMATGNNFAAGDWIVLSGLGGAVQLNGQTYVVAAVAGAAITLQDLYGNAVNGVGFGAWTGGGTAARIYTLITPYAASDLPLLKFTQSADVMSLTHPNYPPYDLSRISATSWTLLPAAFGALIAAPAACTVAATVHPTTSTSPAILPAAYAYCATAIAAIGGEESIASPIGNVTNGVDIAQTAGSNIVQIAPVRGAGSYNIYRAPTSYNTLPGNAASASVVPAGASFGYAGTIFGTTFVDSNVTVDFTVVPPLHVNPFAPSSVLAITIGAAGSGYTTATVAITSATGSGFVGQAVISNAGVVAVIVQNAGANYAAGNTVTITGDGSGATATLTVGPATGTYPGCVAYFQQRRVYASTLNNPDTYYMSKPGSFLNFDSAVPVSDGDAIIGTPWSQQVNGISFMVPMPGGLVVLTGLGAWQVSGAGSSTGSPQAITPSNQQAQPQAYNGCSAIVPPITINFDILYVQAKGSIVRDLNYNFFLNVYTGVDLTQISGHLFSGFQIREWCWCEEPYKVLWAVRSDYTLLSLTYLKEQEVYGWAHHDTFGQIYSVCSVVEQTVDALYMVVRRLPSGGAVNGQDPYYIERMDNRLWTTAEDVWAVDCGVRLAPPQPAAYLNTYQTTGTGAAFFCAPGVFVPQNVGQIIRGAGGIAVVTQYVSATEVIANILKPFSQSINDLVGGVYITLAPGLWSIGNQYNVVSGLNHLVGLTVTGLADGVVIPPTVVSATGTISLPHYASIVTVGLPFQAQFQSAYANPPSQMTEQGQRKDIVAATVRVEASAGIKAGTNQVDGSTTFPPTTAAQWTGMVAIKDQGSAYVSGGGGTVQQLFTGDMRVNLFASFRKPGQVALQQDNPLPMSILGIMPEGLEGDMVEQTYSPPRDQKQGARGPGAWMIS